MRNLVNTAANSVERVILAILFDDKPCERSSSATAAAAAAIDSVERGAIIAILMLTRANVLLLLLSEGLFS